MVKDPFIPPHVRLGDTVWWKPHPKEQPAAALVTRVDGGTLALLIFPPGYHNGLVRTGVRHQDDPGLTSVVAKESGCWERRPESKPAEPKK